MDTLLAQPLLNKQFNRPFYDDPFIMTTIAIRINGESVTVSARCSLIQALESWPKTGVKKSYVIALNQNFIARSQYKSTMLKANDNIEMLAPMAGG